MIQAKYIKSVLFLGILTFLILPLLQSKLEILEIPGLKGSFKEVPDSQLSVNSWFEGSFQEQKGEFINNHFGFRNVLVRLYNQIQYSLFNEVNARKTILGENGMLYETEYVRAGLGLDFMGETNLKINVKKLGAVRDTLERLGKEFIFVLAPGKGTYYPEYYPEKYNDSIQSQTNYELFSLLLKKNDFNVLDLNEWFRNAKDTTIVPLFSKTGIHWTKYGEYLVMDSLLQYIEELQGAQLPSLVLDTILTTSEFYNTDDDIEQSLNLFSDIPDYNNLIYPVFHFEVDSNTVRPKVLTIADSFYWGLHNSGLTDNAYENGNFWYYFEEVYPPRFGGETKVSELNLTKELGDFDMVIVLCTEINIYSFGFIETAYEAYFSGAKGQMSPDRINYFKRQIVNDQEWYDKVTKQAEEKGISVEACIQENAEYMVFQESLE